MGRPKKIDYSQQFKNDGQILSKIVDPLKAKGMEYLGYIAYALYKIEKNKEIENYIKAHPNASDQQIQDKKEYFRYSHCNDVEINRYWEEARNIDNQMYAKKISDYIEGFDNGAKGERENLKTIFQDILSNKVGEAIEGKYKLEKENSFGRGVLQSFLGTIVWIVLTIVVGLYLRFGRNIDPPSLNSNETGVQQVVTDSNNSENDTTMTVKYNQ